MRIDKERLEAIENNLDPLGYGMGGHLISVNDINWLVGYAKKQAERVWELEDVNSQLGYLLGKVYGENNFEINDLIKQNKRYREVIEEIKKTSDDYRAGNLLDIQDSFFVDEIIAIIDKLEESK